MRAGYPERDGYVERNGARIYYEVYDNDGPTVLLAQTWQTTHSRHWKFQIPYLARHFRVITYDPVGNGNSDRSLDPNRYSFSEILEDAIAVLDTTETESCVAVGLSYGGGIVTMLGALYPDRVDGVVSISASHAWGVPLPGRADIPQRMFEPVEDPHGWDKYNVHHWRNDWRDFVEFSFGQCYSDPHSTKGWDDIVSWAMETTGEVIAAEASQPPSFGLDEMEQAVRAMDTPVLIVHGTGDQIVNYESSLVLEKMISNAELLTLEEAGHIPTGRYPVRITMRSRTLSTASMEGGVSKLSGISVPDAARRRCTSHRPSV